MPIQFSLTLSFPFPFFLSQVSGPLLNFPASSFDHLVPLFPQFGAVQWDKEDIAAGTGVAAASVKDLVKPRIIGHNVYNY